MVIIKDNFEKLYLEKVEPHLNIKTEPNNYQINQNNNIHVNNQYNSNNIFQEVLLDTFNIMGNALQSFSNSNINNLDNTTRELARNLGNQMKNYANCNQNSDNSGR